MLHLAVAAGEAPPPTLIAPVAEEIFAVRGSKDQPVTDVRVSQLTFRHVSPTYMYAP